MATVHRHPHGPDFGRAFAAGVAINLGFVLVEAAAGLLAGSLALLSDAAHNLGDVLGLLLAWGAGRLALRPRSARRTYGLRRGTILAALANAVLLPEFLPAELRKSASESFIAAPPGSPPPPGGLLFRYRSVLGVGLAVSLGVRLCASTNTGEVKCAIPSRRRPSSGTRRRGFCATSSAGRDRRRRS